MVSFSKIIFCSHSIVIVISTLYVATSTKAQYQCLQAVINDGLNYNITYFFLSKVKKIIYTRVI